MKSAYVNFNEIVLDVMDETGITNLANKEPSIRRMVSNAEKDINPYSGFFTLKTVKFYKGGPWFDGTVLIKPDDFMELDKVGSCKCKLCPGDYIETGTHIILCKNAPSDSITISYWAINCDGYGNPVTTENHRRAVVAYIVWKLNSQKIFINNGSVRNLMFYQESYDILAKAARGHDAFPTEEDIEGMHYIMKVANHEIYNATPKFKSQVLSCECKGIIETEKPDEEDPDRYETNVYWGQFFKPIYNEIPPEEIDYIIENFPDYLGDSSSFPYYFVDKISMNQAETGFIFNYEYVGRYFFIIHEVDGDNFDVLDILGQSLLNDLNVHVDSVNKRIVIFSQHYVSPSSIFLKFVKV